ncbi:hypothetical protein SGRA_3945 [Saprospira grandis str. Lewin]|uniref:Uncharacterized protein n=1 Tax=Saprospira grandis (strain Lewin) TaxID=984262 RepID=H6L769_SAPGL|nr:hypothetical protein SGRA_3945 [Saprospira grandis str. Lewin]
MLRRLILAPISNIKFLTAVFLGGLPPTAAGPFQGSQVCSALRQQAGLVCRCAAPFQAPRPSRFAPLRRLRRLLAVAAG